VRCEAEVHLSSGEECGGFYEHERSSNKSKCIPLSVLSKLACREAENMNGDIFEDLTVLITGGTGSLGNALTERLLAQNKPPEKIIIFSRDELKQYQMRLRFQNLSVGTLDDATYFDFNERVQFVLGDLRDYRSIREAIKGVDVVFHAAAMKHVPVAEYNTYEAIKTNVIGAENLVSAIIDSDEPVESVIGISTDKSCNPVCAYGATKMLMERIFIGANMRTDYTRFVLTRYGNVMGSTGSVLPLFKNQIENKKPVTVTDPKMTRYLVDKEQSVNTVFSAYEHGFAGQIFVPVMPSAKIMTIARCMAEGTESEVKITGIRPGEKLHEVLISEEEMNWTTFDYNHFIVNPMLPELSCEQGGVPVDSENMKEYSSANSLVCRERIQEILKKEGYL
jgi:UDP-glucose 4-epimerase